MGKGPLDTPVFHIEIEGGDINLSLTQPDSLLKIVAIALILKLPIRDYVRRAACVINSNDLHSSLIKKTYLVVIFSSFFIFIYRS